MVVRIEKMVEKGGIIITKKSPGKCIPIVVSQKQM